MGGVDGDALGAVDGGGVAEAGRGLNVVGAEPDGEPAAVMADGQFAMSTDMGDGPTVTVLDPVGGRKAELSAIGAG
jgi:hypothetical protein